MYRRLRGEYVRSWEETATGRKGARARCRAWVYVVWAYATENQARREGSNRCRCDLPRRIREVSTPHLLECEFAVFPRHSMTYVVTESCIKCKYTDCVDVCPVDCFREGPNILVIDPDECIDCTLCVAECPVEAIFSEDDVPTAQKAFIAINKELSKAWKPLV